MKKEVKERINKVICWFIFIMIMAIIIFLAFSFIRLTILMTDKDIYCQSAFYGIDNDTRIMKYVDHKVFGEVCVLYNKNNFEIINTFKYDYQEMKEYCEVPKFFDLTKWRANFCLK